MIYIQNSVVVYNLFGLVHRGCRMQKSFGDSSVVVYRDIYYIRTPNCCKGKKISSIIIIILNYLATIGIFT